MEYNNMKLRLQAMVEDDLANATRKKLAHKANAEAIPEKTKEWEMYYCRRYHNDLVVLYEGYEATFNQYLSVIQKLDDDLKWMLYHLKNMQDMPNEMIRNMLENIKDVVIEWNYLKEGK